MAERRVKSGLQNATCGGRNLLPRELHQTGGDGNPTRVDRNRLIIFRLVDGNEDDALGLWPDRILLLVEVDLKAASGQSNGLSGE
jgi:hypothetical protein